MSMFTPLEQAAFAAILCEAIDDRAVIEQQLAQAIVLSRENTGGGFFTELEIGSDAIKLEAEMGSLGKNVWMAVDGLKFGLGMILHIKAGRVNLLEGYAVAPENTSLINFGDVRFAMADEPGPLPPNAS